MRGAVGTVLDRWSAERMDEGVHAGTALHHLCQQVDVTEGRVDALGGSADSRSSQSLRSRRPTIKAKLKANG